MEFKLFFESQDDAHSWLSPAGKFFPLNGGQHGLWARKNGETMESMWDKGWFRIYFYGQSLFAHNERIKSLTAIQKRELVDLAITGHFSRLYQDSGDDERCLWSDSDAM